MYNIFDKINQLQSELSGLTITDKDQRRLDEKLRLEFNYNSNHMEGNTLSYQDTKVLLLKDILPQGKLYKMRELDEMRAHDAAFMMIKEWATDPSREINQNDIRELNRIILVKDFYKDAIDFNGKPTRKKIKVGEYKEYPNSVLLQNGEVFHYADPIEVPALMRELIDWYQDEKESLHPIKLAALFHHKFVLIHPFDDGNGRISRLLMNYILMRHGYPPVVIKSAQKDKYLNALRLADAGDMESFIFYIAEQAEWSLDITTKASKGESIDEMGDLNKKLDFLLKQNHLKSEFAGKYSIEKLDYLMNNSFSNLFMSLENILEKFDMLYNERVVECRFNNGIAIYLKQTDSIINEYFYFSHNVVYFEDEEPRVDVKAIDIKIELKNPVNPKINNMVVTSDLLRFQFYTNRIESSTEDGKVITQFTYDNGISDYEQQVIIEYIGNNILNKMPIDYDPTISNQF